MVELRIGDAFATKQKLLTAVALHSGGHGVPGGHSFEPRYERSDHQVVTVVCAGKAEGCRWRLYVKRDSRHASAPWIVRTLAAKHTCPPQAQRVRRKSYGYREVADLFHDQLMRDATSLSAGDMVRALARDYGLQCSYVVCHRARELVLRNRVSDDSATFVQLGRFLTLLQHKNPGTHVVIDVVERRRVFHRAFLATSAAIGAWQHLRLVLGLGHTPMENAAHGVLLVAHGVDAVGAAVPLAHALVDAVTVDNWKWFLVQLVQALMLTVPAPMEHGGVVQGSEETVQARELVVLSSRSSTLVPAVAAVLPHAHHGLDMSDVLARVAQLFPKHKTSDQDVAETSDATVPDALPEVQALIMQVAAAKTEKQYEKLLSHMWTISPMAHRFVLNHLSPANYVDYAFPGKRYGHYCFPLTHSEHGEDGGDEPSEGVVEEASGNADDQLKEPEDTARSVKDDEETDEEIVDEAHAPSSEQESTEQQQPETDDGRKSSDQAAATTIEATEETAVDSVTPVLEDADSTSATLERKRPAEDSAATEGEVVDVDRVATDASAAPTTSSKSSLFAKPETLLPFPAFQMIVRQDASTFINRKVEHARFQGDLPECWKALVDDMTKQAQSTLQALQTGEGVFEVIESAEKNFVVDLGKRECSCLTFQALAFPCVHAVAALLTSGQPITEFVAAFYSQVALQATYSVGMTMVTMDEMQELAGGSEDASASSAPVKRPVGRPPKKKTKVAGAVADTEKRPLHCSLCGLVGHNKRRCQAVAASPA